MTAVEKYAGGSADVIVGGQLEAFKQWAQTISTAGILPDGLRGKPADILITVMHGLDLGLKPMQAFNLVHVVKGRPSLSAEGMRALILRDGHEFEVVTSTITEATVRGRRRGSETWHEAAFTMEQAKKAKLGGANWEAYPEDMLLARATSRLARRYFGDVIGGLPSVEEVLDNTEEPKPRLVLGGKVGPEIAATPAEVAAQIAALEAEHVDAELVEEPDQTEPLWPDVTPAGGEQ